MTQDLDNLLSKLSGYKKRGMGTTHSPRPGPFIEALPRFNVLTLDQQFRSGLHGLIWTDQAGEIVGLADIDLLDLELGLSYKFRKGPHVEQQFNEARFALKRSSPGIVDWRPVILCGECGKPRNVMIFFERHWACRSCHHVNHRSTHIDVDTRRYRQFLELRKIAENPRPRHMRHQKYDAIIEDYRKQSREWDHKTPRTLNADHLAAITERYVAASDMPDWRTALMPRDGVAPWTIDPDRL